MEEEASMSYTMKTRQEIKEIAKNELRLNRGQCIGVYLLTAIIAAILSSVTAGFGSIILAPVMSVAYCGFFLAVYRGESATVSQWFSTLFDRFLAKLGGYLWMLLWVMLWSCLFCIPGIIKALSYSMTSYILADCPNVKPKDALRLSMRMTNGYKMDIFVAGLSFFGWQWLSVFTFGLLDILHVGPYKQITYAGIYEELKKNAIENGVIAAEEFEGAPVTR